MKINFYPSLLQHIFDIQPSIKQCGSSCLHQIVKRNALFNFFNPKLNQNMSFCQTGSDSVW